MQKTPVLIAIAGGSGSGKTYLARQICQDAGVDDVAFLSMDQYFVTEDGHDPQHINFDHPSHLDLERFIRDLKTLISGNPIVAPNYDFRTMTQTPNAIEVQPKPVVIVEGLFVLADPISELYDLSIFLDVAADQRLLGRILRDADERGATLHEVVDRYQRYVRPSYQVFIAPTKQNADVIVDFTYRRAFFTQLLTHVIRDYVRGSLEMAKLVEAVRSDTYNFGYNAEEGWMPLTTDIFKLAAAFPQSRFSAPHEKQMLLPGE